MKQLKLAGALPPVKPRNIEELVVHTEAIGKVVSTILTELATGKYDKEIDTVEGILAKIAIGLPAFGMVEKGLEMFLWINRITAPAGPIVPDGQGGWVPQSNSRYDPATGKFL